MIENDEKCCENEKKIIKFWKNEKNENEKNENWKNWKIGCAQKCRKKNKSESKCLPNTRKKYFFVFDSLLKFYSILANQAAPRTGYPPQYNSVALRD